MSLFNFMKFRTRQIAIIAFVFFTLSALAVRNNCSYGQTVIPLYDGVIPNSKPAPDLEHSEVRDSILIISKISRPSLSIYLPEKAKSTGAAVIICPGGGYWVEAAGHEGADVARKFNEWGIAAFVLKYRIPDDHTMIRKDIGPVQDGQQALMLVRSRAKEWNIDPNKVGIMGFSAGGHVASTVGTHFKKDYIPNPVHINLRPDFMLLVYPVISFTDSIGHIGSRDQLIGKDPPDSLIREYSNELQVTNETPPAFLVQAKDDGVKVENSIVFAEALRKHQVPAGIYLFEKGGHGYGMNNKFSTVKWMDLVFDWLREMEFVRH